MQKLKASSLRLGRTLASTEFVSFIFGIFIGYYFVELFVLSTPSIPHWMNYFKSFDGGILDDPKHVRLHDYNENSTIAAKLYKEVRVLCWILTKPENHKNYARRIKRSWGKHCNKFLLMSTTADEQLGTIALNVSGGHFHRWGQTKAGFEYVYKHHFDEADWFLKADDDSYVVLENLRYMLYSYSPETAIYFGQYYKRFLFKDPVTGGTNYVLSKQALRRFVLEALPQSRHCRQSAHGAEDVEMAKCLKHVNVKAGETRDAHGCSRFYPYSPDYLIIQLLQKKNGTSPSCSSRHAISFSHVPQEQIFVLHYLIHFLRPYGVLYVPESLPERSELVAPTISKENENIK